MRTRRHVETHLSSRRLLLHQAYSVFFLMVRCEFPPPTRPLSPALLFCGNTPTGGNPSQQPRVAAAPGLLGVPGHVETHLSSRRLLLHQAYSVFFLMVRCEFPPPTRPLSPALLFCGNTPTGGNPSQQPRVAAAPGLLGVPVRSQGESADAAEGGLEAHVRGLLDEHLLQVRLHQPRKNTKVGTSRCVRRRPSASSYIPLRRITKYYV